MSMTITAKEQVQYLNSVLKYALTGINQYFLHARILKHQGLMKLADAEYRQSLSAMKQADMLVDHVLSLGGIPDMQHLAEMQIGKHSGDMLTNDLALAEAAIAQIRDALSHIDDHATTELLRKILANKEEHCAFIRGQLAAKTAA